MFKIIREFFGHFHPSGSMQPYWNKDFYGRPPIPPTNGVIFTKDLTHKDID